MADDVDAVELFSNLNESRKLDQPVSYFDQATQQSRLGWFEDQQLELAVYLSNGPVVLSREWLVSQLSTPQADFQSRLNVLAGKPGGDQADKGAIICACMNVGSHEINEAIGSGIMEVSEIGRATQAGTNCGSCRSEISGMINAFKKQIAIAAE